DAAVLGGFPMTSKRKGGLALLGFLFAIHAFAQSAAPAAKPASTPEARPKAAAPAAASSKPVKVTTVEGITEYRLPNGPRGLLFPDPGNPTVTLTPTYMVAPRHENYGETGMAHLLEHMMFKGSANHPHITQELTKHGARNNASTWYDRTNYFE